MKNALWTPLVIIVTAVCGIADTVRAQEIGKQPLVRVGIVIDGPWERNEEILRLFEKEILELTRGEFDIRFPKDKRIVSDWSVAGVKAAIDTLLADPAVDLLLTLGVLGSNDVGHRPSLSKPVVAPFVPDRKLQGFPYKAGSSGLRNLSYITFPVDVRRDLKVFHGLVRFNHVTFLFDKAIRDAIPRLPNNARQAAKELGVDITFVPVDTLADPVLAALPRHTEAVYIAPLLRLPAREYARLIKGLIKERLPSFALFGRTEVERGVLAGVAPAVTMNRLARRTALNIQRILLGEDAGTLSVSLVLRERLTLNMATARAIGFSPRFEVMRTAELLFEETRRIDRRLSLTSVVREAVEVNLDVKLAQRDVAAGREVVRTARAALLPQLDLLADRVHIDDDRAAAIPGQAEKTTSGSVALSQVLYSEPTFANVAIQRHLQRSREAERDQVRLDIVLDAANAYLDVLRAKTSERIAKDNVELSRRNLDLANLRRRIGTAGPGEVFRWESEIATDRQGLVQAEAQRRVAEIALNQLLHRPLAETFATTEVGLDDPVLITSQQRLIDLIGNPRAFAVFGNFMVEEGLGASTELRQIEAAIDAQKRTFTSTKRAFWQPDLNLTAEQTEVVSRSGTGRSGLGFSSDDTETTVALQLSFPLYTGGARDADRTRAFEELMGLRLQQQSTRERVEQRIRAALHNARAAYATIALSRDAADAARKNLKLVQDAYRRGVLSILDLLDAQNASIVADEAAANAVYDFLKNLMEVERAVSRFDFFQTPEAQADWFRRLETYFKGRGVFTD